MHSNGYNYSKRRFIRPINDLLLDQRKGKFLTPEEKQELKKICGRTKIKKQK